MFIQKRLFTTGVKSIALIHLNISKEISPSIFYEELKWDILSVKHPFKKIDTSINSTLLSLYGTAIKNNYNVEFVITDKELELKFIMNLFRTQQIMFDLENYGINFQKFRKHKINYIPGCLKKGVENSNFDYDCIDIFTCELQDLSSA